jgi:hypothetical protein
MDRIESINKLNTWIIQQITPNSEIIHIYTNGMMLILVYREGLVSSSIPYLNSEVFLLVNILVTTQPKLWLKGR